MYYRFKIDNGNLIQTENKNEAVWTHLEMPTDTEMSEFQEMAQVPAHIMKDVLDPDEMPHVDFYDDSHVLFLDVPVIIKDTNPQNQTRPFCIVIKKEHICTISAFPFELLSNLKDEYIENPKNQSDVLLTVLFTVTSSYISAIKEMEGKSSWKASDFKTPPEQNTMFFELLDLQKSMIDFETSVEANHMVLQAVKDKMSDHFDAHQKLWLDNLVVESDQIGKMCAVFSEVLNATSNISESVVSNNLNDVMKTLTSLTILFSVPTIVTAIFTMNTEIPTPVNHILYPILFSVIAAVLLIVFLRRKKML